MCFSGPIRVAGFGKSVRRPAAEVLETVVAVGNLLAKWTPQKRAPNGRTPLQHKDPNKVPPPITSKKTPNQALDFWALNGMRSLFRRVGPRTCESVATLGRMARMLSNPGLKRVPFLLTGFFFGNLTPQKGIRALLGILDGLEVRKNGRRWCQ